ncbi:MAG: reverse transcriptase, partial [Candidatus Thiodiazotropha taylori]|nr:reverse transcriptase [Candidatus Thiodiazotropha taylori]
MCNAAATFERLMETVLAGLQWDICLIYIDDVIVHGRTFEEALGNLKTVFERLRHAGLKLKPDKCKLFSKSVSFLGHIISDKGVATDPDKIKAVREWPIPVNLTELRSFLGLCSYYRRFISGFSMIAKPLYRLTEKEQSFLWSDECDESFRTLKKKLTGAPVLAYPDFSEAFILDTDASDSNIGAVLSQIQNGTERVICYGSRSLSKAEKKYCVTRTELLALVYFVKYYRHYLLGRKFTVRTDHNSLRWMLKTKNPEGQLARWIDTLSSFQFEVQHRPGRKHSNADALSRIPCRQCGHKGETIAERVHIGVAVQTDEIQDFNLVDAQSDDSEIVMV